MYKIDIKHYNQFFYFFHQPNSTHFSSEYPTPIDIIFARTKNALNPPWKNYQNAITRVK